jgi:hypothetical protein
VLFLKNVTTKEIYTFYLFHETLKLTRGKFIRGAGKPSVDWIQDRRSF